YHECAQLFDLARNAAEHDVQHVRKAWQLQESVSDVLQKLDGDCENKEFKDLAEIYFKSLETRFEAVRQSFSDESARWEVVIDSLQHLLRHTRFLLYPPNSLTTQHIYAQSCIDYAKNAIRRCQMETLQPSDDFDTASKGLKTAQDEVDNGNYPRALELVCQAENEIESTRRQSLLKTLKEKEERKTTLFSLIRAHQRVREKHSSDQNQRNVGRKENWLGSDPEEIASVWSRQTFWARGLTLGLLDPLPVTTAAMFTSLAPDGDLKLGDDMLDTRKIAGSQAAGPADAEGGPDPFAKFAAGPGPGGDPFAAFAGGAKDDPFAAFAGGDPMAPLPGTGADEADDTPTPDPDAAFGMSPGPAPDKAEDSDITEVIPSPASLLKGSPDSAEAEDKTDETGGEDQPAENAETPNAPEAPSSDEKTEDVKPQDVKPEVAKPEVAKPEVASETDKVKEPESGKDEKVSNSDEDAKAPEVAAVAEKTEEKSSDGSPSTNGDGKSAKSSKKVDDESGEAQANAESETSKKS
ncbi:MAG: hypothetical protein P1V97_35965, partial [Planctomycetota bacterium]|nr:hypothetical protein [Planctomycetota bacterium]